MTINDLMTEKLFKQELVKDDGLQKTYLHTLIIPAKTKLYGKNSFTPLFLDDIRDMNNVFLRMMRMKGVVLKEKKFPHKLLVSDKLKASANIVDIRYSFHYYTEFEAINESDKDERIYLIAKSIDVFEAVHLDEYHINMCKLK